MSVSAEKMRPGALLAMIAGLAEERNGGWMNLAIKTM
jgi:hypothetical protein